MSYRVESVKQSPQQHNIVTCEVCGDVADYGEDYPGNKQCAKCSGWFCTFHIRQGTSESGRTLSVCDNCMKDMSHRQFTENLNYCDDPYHGH